MTVQKLLAPRTAALATGVLVLGYALVGFTPPPKPTVRRLNPAQLPVLPYLSQVVTVEGGHSFAHIAGQTAINTKFEVVGSDVPTQLRVALENMDHALNAVGASRHDLVRITVYFVDGNGAPDEVTRAIRDYFGGRDLPAATYVGVPALVGEGMLVEIEGLALLRGDER